MASSGIKVKFSGFEELLDKIQKAGGTIERATESCVKESAQIMQAELKSAMQSANVDSGLINRMPPPEIEIEGNRYTARVGYKKGSYDAANLTDGYKVVFLNYGTPRRSEHGKVEARGFIQKAKKKATPKIKKAQATTLEKILGRLNG